MPLHLAIIEDLPAVRRGLETYLCTQPEFQCGLVVGSVEEFLDRIGDEATPPRLVLSDIGLPGRSGIEGVSLIKQRLPQADVVLLTAVMGDPARVFQALCAGAVGFFLKTTPLSDLKAGLLAVAEGGSSMSPAVAREVVKYFQPVADPEQSLTPREVQVVHAIEQGLSYKLIADQLGISLNTVRRHIKSVYTKLHINSKGELLARALRRPGA
ncbi:response regulator transcription factor [Hymenobacter sp. ASUV-10]|uniref:Response regulator transcription factor n=1 Tax=Hymenobacter aranciens TaxID=3063996 RepID=A0ABT9B4I1_9BACT|nr:response regulator transcription factor [Hymenobacter sp. ASUV-10]MDO7873171.1 response regulator transcription factor [Hymenobacter sp. ASUV-10]